MARKSKSATFPPGGSQLYLAGARNDATTANARAAIDAELAKQKLKAKGYRLLGYNSPFVPRSKQTHELQALIQ